VTQALAAIDRLKPQFVADAIAQLAIKDQYKGLTKMALERSKKILLAV
jgi:hypothetical protein